MAKKKSIVKPKKNCVGCGENKNEREFYSTKSNRYADGKIPFCKSCIHSMHGNGTEEELQDLLQTIDKPFLYDYYVSAVQSEQNTLGAYIRFLNLQHLKDLTWKDSVFELKDEKKEELEKAKKKNERKKQKDAFEVTEEIKDRWGEGYTKEDYQAFERKYNFLIENYQERTSMHSEALLNYVRTKVKEEQAIAQGDSKDAKEWGNLAQKYATAAKINPSQLSKADLQDGLNTFGELARAVEKNVDIIPILPKYKNRPQDKVDVTIWHLINYIRKLKGLPEAEYDEIYQFYEERKREAKESYGIDFDEEVKETLEMMNENSKEGIY